MQCRDFSFNSALREVLVTLSFIQSWMESKGYLEHSGFKGAYIFQIFYLDKDHAFPESQQLTCHILKALHIYKMTFQTDIETCIGESPPGENFVCLGFLFSRTRMWLFSLLLFPDLWLDPLLTAGLNSPCPAAAVCLCHCQCWCVCVHTEGKMEEKAVRG